MTERISVWNDTSDVNSIKPKSISTVVSITYEIVIPTELIVGFTFQLCNLAVLQNHKINCLAYSFFFKALSVNYLISAVVLIPSLLVKIGRLDRTSYIMVFYHTHLEQFFANLFLFGGNVISVAMATCPLVALYFPLRHLNFGSRKNLWVVITAYASVAIVLIPTTMMKEVQKMTDSNGSVFYFTVDNTQAWVRTSRYIVAAIFEIVVILLVLIIYALILIKYRHIVRSNVTQVHKKFQTGGRLLASNHRKATVICLAWITAFLICNLPSALMETFHLIYFVQKNLETFNQSNERITMRLAVNVLLVFNFTLSVILQYAASGRYRNLMHKLLRCNSKTKAKHNEKSYITTSLLYSKIYSRQSVKTLQN
ncbi:Probableputative G-protein coupled receptor [Trichinella papuae]|uniref:Probableputative G-protein coupled receptor n=1 Tax=Trichinella papuae TaxID=268474 RepID=A0A0V1MMN8_9BILA|nr:Probableputative G-protein coupled receptor [Trichinella papuae]